MAMFAAVTAPNKVQGDEMKGGRSEERSEEENNGDVFLYFVLILVAVSL